MTEIAETVPATPAATTPKKKKTPKAKSSGPKKTATHPPTASMVNAAIKSLNERGGSSLQAIKKYISSTYKIDAEKLAPFIKKYLKSAADKGALIRTKGKGAAGSFKLPPKGEGKAKKAVAPKKKKAATPKKAGKAAAKPKKAKSPKKAAAKKASKPKAAKPTTPKAPKVKKAKTPKKPKTPKPKKAAPKKAAKKPVAKK